MMSDRMLASEDNLRDLHGVVEQCQSQIEGLASQVTDLAEHCKQLHEQQKASSQPVISSRSQKPPTPDRKPDSKELRSLIANEVNQ